MYRGRSVILGQITIDLCSSNKLFFTPKMKLKKREFFFQANKFKLFFFFLVNDNVKQYYYECKMYREQQPRIFKHVPHASPSTNLIILSMVYIPTISSLSHLMYNSPHISSIHLSNGSFYCDSTLAKAHTGMYLNSYSLCFHIYFMII